jgi:kynurenine formamidase
LSTEELLSTLLGRRVYSLAVRLEEGMPKASVHPAFMLSLIRRHGDIVRDDDCSSASELIVMGGHTGTHIDALGHYSEGGRLFGGIRADDAQRGLGRRLNTLDVCAIDPMFCAGVLVDLPRVRGIEALPAGYEITGADLDEAEAALGLTIGRGSAVLLHTGWMRDNWHDPATYVGQQSGVPGLGVSGAAWLSEREVAVVGTDTHRVEVMRVMSDPHEPVHRDMLVRAGIPLLEMVSTTELSRDGVSTFLFVAAPLPLVGATGSPLHPIAVV